MTQTMKYNHSYLSVLAAGIFLTLMSCENTSFLDVYPETQIVEDQYYKTENQFRLATIGAYEIINADKAQGVTIKSGTYFSGLLGTMCAPSDEIIPSRAQNNESRVTDMFRASYTESTPVLRSVWDACYMGIQRCNAIIAHAAPFDDELIRAHAVEATFLRGFYYWYLAQIFGAVPKASVDGPRESLDTIYRQIISDFSTAYDLLPGDRSSGVLGAASANRYTAAAYLGRVYLYLAACKDSGTGVELLAEQPLNDFSWVDAQSCRKSALDCLKDVVENSGYCLIEDFTNLFRETTKTEQHRECLLLAENYVSGSENIFPSSQTFAFAPGSNGDEAKGQTPTVYTGFLLSSPKIFGMYSPSDPRRDWFFTSDGSGKLIEETAVDGIKYVKPFDRNDGEARVALFVDNYDTQSYVPWQKSAAAIGKYRFAQLGQVPSHTRNEHCLSIPLMRFADVKLMYAEALYYAASDEAGARAQLYDVLLRACGNDEVLAAELESAYHKDDFVEELLESRERELCFEGSRKYDLMRYNRLHQTMLGLTRNVVVERSGTPYYEFQAWKKFGTEDYVYFSAADFNTGGQTLKDNWTEESLFKIWAPISSIQIAANPKLTQNARW